MRCVSMGVGEGDSVAVMCRNHRFFVDATIAAAKLGADILYLNTAFAGPQLVEVLEREAPGAVIHDEEFSGLLDKADTERRILAWTDGDVEGDTVEALIRSHPTTDHAAPEKHSRVVILTSGTTGTPKGAPRSEAGIDAAVALLERIPLRAGTPMHIAAPLFHTWGFAHLALGMLLGTTAVLRRRYDPEDCLKVHAGRGLPLGRRDPGDAAADHGAAPGDARLLRPVHGAGRLVLGLRAAGGPGHRLDGRVRRQPLQHLRLDRGGLRQHRHPRRPPGRADRPPAGRRWARS